MTGGVLTTPRRQATISSALVERRRPLPAGALPFVSVGDTVSPQQPIAEARGDRGEQSAQPVLAGLGGRVIATQPGQSVTIGGAALALLGMIGLGEQVAGPLYFPQRGESLAVAPLQRGAIIVYPGRAPLTLLQRALTTGAVGVIAGSASALEVEAFARADLTGLLDGYGELTALPPLTVTLTEGLGDAPMRAELLAELEQRAGSVALLSGLTRPRQGIRPEILLSPAPGANAAAPPVSIPLIEGATVRLTGGSRRGARGRIARLFALPQRVETGQWAPSALVRLDDGAMMVAPLALLDSAA